MTKIPVQKQGTVGFLADMLMIPIMYVLQGNFRESPQRTHRWNNHHLRNLEIDHLDSEKFLMIDGDEGARERWLGPIPLFHMPIFGGWSKYVVIEPAEGVSSWHIGWVAFDVLGVSKIPLNGPVRVGIGPRQAVFFGLNSLGEQIQITQVGEGRIGAAGEHTKVLFL